jgi:type VI secretion system protein ImpK
MPFSPNAPAKTFVRSSYTACYEDVFTKIVRLRSGADRVTDWRAFRKEIKALIEEANGAAGLLPFDSKDDVDDARYAVVSFVDTAVMTSELPEFRDWQSQSLQNELFRTGYGGGDFFLRLLKILRRPETPATADLLDLFLTCILLGFEGRVPERLPDPRGTTAGKIARLRRQVPELSPRWRPSGRRIAVPNRGTGIGLAANILVGVAAGSAILFIGFLILLGLGASRFADLVAR